MFEKSSGGRSETISRLKMTGTFIRAQRKGFYFGDITELNLRTNLFAPVSKKSNFEQNKTKPFGAQGLIFSLGPVRFF